MGWTSMWAVAGFALCTVLAGAASAGPLAFDTGDTVRYRYYFPDSVTVFDEQTTVIGAGVEFPGSPSGDPRTNVDVSLFTIFITYNSTSTWTTASFNGMELFDVGDAWAPFDHFIINAATNMVGLDASRITLTADSIAINWNGLDFDAGTIVSLTVINPEPGSLALFGLGAAGIAAYGVRRRRAAARGRTAR